MNEKKENRMNDLISRQAAFDVVKRLMGDSELSRTVQVGLHILPSAQPERWIPCSERLPNDEKRVLCTVQSGEYFYVVPCVFIQSTRRWLPDVHGNHDNVIAWRPLPEPYKGEQE